MLFKNREYLRSVLFGVEDSLVSTTGLIAGISIGSDSNKLVLLAGVVAITIEAVSMGAGEYLSDDAMQDLDKIKRHHDNPLLSGALMLISYFLAGFIPLAPVIFIPFPQSVIFSVIFALVGLFLLGYFKGKILKTSTFRGAFKMLIVGGIATILGLVVGLLFKV